MKLAAEGKVRMTVTSNGPWDKDIHYKGPKGSKYENSTFDLTSGSKCVINCVREAFGDLPETPFELPSNLPYQPEKMFRKGELYWAHYNENTMKDPHGEHIKLVAPFVQKYGVPWMAGERGGAGLQNLIGGDGGTTAQKLVVGGIAAVAALFAYRYWKARSYDIYPNCACSHRP